MFVFVTDAAVQRHGLGRVPQRVVPAVVYADTNTFLDSLPALVRLQAQFILAVPLTGIT